MVLINQYKMFLASHWNKMKLVTKYFTGTLASLNHKFLHHWELHKTTYVKPLEQHSEYGKYWLVDIAWLLI